MLKAKKRRFIVATTLMIISAVLMTTASFAWFAMNTSTSADNFKVEAYTDSLYLQISKNGTDYATSQDFATPATKPLRLVTYDRITTSTNLYKGSFNLVNSDVYYDGTGTYYKVADSDVNMFGGGNTNTYWKLDGDTYKKQTLTASDSVVGLYKNLVFTLIEDEINGDNSTIYYTTADGADFVPSIPDTSTSLKGVYYTLSQEGVTGAPVAVSAAYNYVLVTGLEQGTDLTELYTGLSFVPQLGGKGDGTTVYYEEGVNGYTKVTPIPTSSDDVKGYFRLQQNGDYVNDGNPATPDTYKTGTYYETAGTTGFKVATLSEGDSVNGKFAGITFEACAATGETADGSTVYFNVSEGVYTPVKPSSGADLDDTYFKMSQNGTPVTDGEPVAEKFVYTADNTNVYWSKNASGDFALKEDITAGTNLKGYYTVVMASTALEQVPVETSDFDGESQYFVYNGRDYACIGIPEANTPVLNYLYWGRSYSNQLGDAEKTNTLNVLPTLVDAEAKAASEYYLYNTFYLRQGENTNHGKNLRASVTVGGAYQNMKKLLRVLIIATSESGESVAVEYSGRDDSITADGLLFDTILGDEQEVITVDVYIYFDGRDDDAHNNEFKEINSQNVSIEFSIDELEYNKVN